MKMDQLMKGHVPKIQGRVFCRRKAPAGAAEHAKSLVPGCTRYLVPLGTPKSMKTDKIQKGHVPKILGRVFPKDKKEKPLRERQSTLKAWYQAPGTILYPLGRKKQ